MSFRYKPEDFAAMLVPPWKHKEACGIANSLLEAHEKTLPRVYQRNSEPYVGKKFETGVWTEHKKAADTHTALLYGIEELKK